MRLEARSSSSAVLGRGASLGLLLGAAALILTLLGQARSVEARLVKAFGRALETRIDRGAVPTGSPLDGVIVLGGSPTRVRAALELAHLFPGTTVVLSGPGEAEVALAREGLDAARLEIDRRARTTYENALYSKDLVRPRLGECWVVVTSAVHMPRAMGAFQAVGFPVLPWPVEDTPEAEPALAAWVWHEVLGLVGYWLFGRSSDLFPTWASPCAAERSAST